MIVPSRRPGSPLAATSSGRLGDLAGHLTPEEMWGVDDALATVLDLR